MHYEGLTIVWTEQQGIFLRSVFSDALVGRSDPWDLAPLLPDVGKSLPRPEHRRQFHLICKVVVNASLKDSFGLVKSAWQVITPSHLSNIWKGIWSSGCTSICFLNSNSVGEGIFSSMVKREIKPSPHSALNFRLGCVANIISVMCRIIIAVRLPLLSCPCN